MPPVNDAFSAARTITGANGSVTGTNLDATFEVGEPVPFVGHGHGSIWFAWTAPSDGPIVFDTLGSLKDGHDLDTVLEVFTGSAVDTLTWVTGNDDAPGGPPYTVNSSLTLEAVGGTTYRIRVVGYLDDETGSVVLHWAPSPAVTITSVTPAHSIPSERIDVYGTRFTGVTEVTVTTGDVAYATSFVRDSDSHLYFLLPVMGAGAGHITVTKPAGAATAPFRVDPAAGINDPLLVTRGKRLMTHWAGNPPMSLGNQYSWQGAESSGLARMDDTHFIGVLNGYAEAQMWRIEPDADGRPSVVHSSYAMARSPNELPAMVTNTQGYQAALEDGVVLSTRMEVVDHHGHWRAVAWSPELGIFVAAGLAGQLATSPNGTTWTARDAGWPEAGRINGLVWAPALHLFIAVGLGANDASHIASSPDGVNWIERESGHTLSLTAVTWRPGSSLFVAVGGGAAVSTSPDGSVWTPRSSGLGSSPYGTGSVVLTDIVWAPELDIFLTVGVDFGYGGIEDIVGTSPDGVTWTDHSYTTSIAMAEVAWAPELGLFAAVGTAEFNREGKVFTSPDGAAWTLRYTVPLLETGSLLRSIVWSPELRLFVASEWFARVFTSPDGLHWTARSGARLPSSYVTAVAWSAALHLFVMVGGSVYLLHGTAISSDGVNWVPRRNGLSQYSLHACFFERSGETLLAGHDTTLLTATGNMSSGVFILDNQMNMIRLIRVDENTLVLIFCNSDKTALNAVVVRRTGYSLSVGIPTVIETAPFFYLGGAASAGFTYAVAAFSPNPNAPPATALYRRTVTVTDMTVDVSEAVLLASRPGSAFWGYKAGAVAGLIGGDLLWWVVEDEAASPKVTHHLARAGGGPNVLVADGLGVRAELLALGATQNQAPGDNMRFAGGFAPIPASDEVMLSVLPDSMNGWWAKDLKPSGEVISGFEHTSPPTTQFTWRGGGGFAGVVLDRTYFVVADDFALSLMSVRRSRGKSSAAGQTGRLSRTD